MPDKEPGTASSYYCCCFKRKQTRTDEDMKFDDTDDIEKDIENLKVENKGDEGGAVAINDD